MTSLSIVPSDKAPNKASISACDKTSLIPIVLLVCY
jgi:hypothetical protein